MAGATRGAGGCVQRGLANGYATRLSAVSRELTKNLGFSVTSRGFLPSRAHDMEAARVGQGLVLISWVKTIAS